MPPLADSGLEIFSVLLLVEALLPPPDSNSDLLAKGALGLEPIGLDREAERGLGTSLSVVSEGGMLMPDCVVFL